ncbi:hypothetical protein H9P43_007079 [Blastocladiella emersonii ATCC 22665]|nr:hypothetical protein H9P43_007079 [Blastocladiella emersonii ATCC 22665]
MSSFNPMQSTEELATILPVPTSTLTINYDSSSDASDHESDPMHAPRSPSSTTSSRHSRSSSASSTSSTSTVRAAGTKTPPSRPSTPPATSARQQAGETSLADVLARFASWVFPKYAPPQQHVVVLGDADVPLVALETLLEPHVGPFADVKLSRELTYRAATSPTHSVKVFPSTTGFYATMLAKAWDSANLIVYVLDPRRDRKAPLPEIVRSSAKQVTFVCAHSLVTPQAVSQRDFLELDLPAPVLLLDASKPAGEFQAAFDKMWATSEDAARKQRLEKLLALKAQTGIVVNPAASGSGSPTKSKVSPM